jgi:protein-ribulosamine 3-kinase
MNPRRISAILNAASAAMGERTSGLVSRRACSGGCIHTAEIWRPTIGPRFFVKFGDASCVDMFRQESIGLAEIRATQTVRVPHTIALVDRSDLDLSALILEAIDVGSPSSKNWYEFGQSLARLHQIGRSSRFGFARDNYLGSASQPNGWDHNWIRFFAQQRLGFQVRWARAQYPAAKSILLRCERLIANLPSLLSQHLEPPTLIHGDLWSGNVIFAQSGEGVLIDPASYYGQREAEWGMIGLFGGFPATFCDGYADIWPLDKDHTFRVPIYRLYHWINHWNLFGDNYLGSCETELARLGY